MDVPLYQFSGGREREEEESIVSLVSTYQKSELSLSVSLSLSLVTFWSVENPFSVLLNFLGLVLI